MRRFARFATVYRILKNVKNTHGGVLLSAKQASAKSNTLPSAFFSFFELYRWYQIAQNIAYLCAVKDIRASSLYFVQSFHKQVFTQLLVKNQYKYKKHK